MNSFCFVYRKPSEPKATYGAENGGVDFKPSQPTKKIVSVLPALCKTFGPEFFLGALLKLVQDLLAFVSPQILKFVLKFKLTSFRACNNQFIFFKIVDQFRGRPGTGKLERIFVRIHSYYYCHDPNIGPWSVFSENVYHRYANQNFNRIICLSKGTSLTPFSSHST